MTTGVYSMLAYKEISIMYKPKPSMKSNALTNIRLSYKTTEKDVIL